MLLSIAVLNLLFNAGHSCGGTMDVRTTFNLSRRRWLLQSGFATGVLAVGPMRAFAASDDGVSRTAEAIHQEVAFNASPKRIYQALTDASLFQKVESLSAAMKSLDISSHAAKISREAGGAFSLFGDYIVGRQIELIEDQRIVQAWRVASWDPGIYFVAHFALTGQGSSTKLVLDHAGFPAGTAEHLAAGWHANYWQPLEKFLGGAQE
jgi:activator of HSP90 ATPase